jgi:PAS domain S-box-containing protein
MKTLARFMRTQFDPAIRLMNRLSFPQKFALISLLFAVPLALTLAGLTRELNASIEFESKEKMGTAYLRPLQALYLDALKESLAEQRFRNGQAPREDVIKSREEIDRHMTTLAQMEQRFSADLGTHEPYQTLLADWQTIKSREVSIDNGDDLIYRFIADARALSTIVVNSSNLLFDPSIDSHYVVDALVVKLPEAQDLIAQMLAFDIPTMAQEGSNAGFARSSTFVGLLQSNSTAMRNSMRIAFQNSGSTLLRGAIEKPLQDNVDTTNKFVNSIGRVWNSQGADAQALEYYNIGIATLDSGDALLAPGMDALDTLLQTRIDASNQQKQIAYALIAAGLILVAYLWVAFYLAVMRTVSRLDQAAKRMASGVLGEQVKLDTRDELGHIVAAFNNIASALVTSSQYRQAIVDSAADGIITTDAQGTLRSFNPAAESIFGYTADEVIGKHINILVPVANRAMFATLTQGFKMGSGRRETNGVRKDGAVFPLDLAVTEARLGTEHLFIALMRDITELKLAEAAMLQAKHEAEAANEAKGTFLANVSHELRTPLTSVLGFARIIQKRLDETIFPNVNVSDRKIERSVKQVRDNLGIILSEGERLTALINNVLDLAKIEAGKIEWHMQPISVKDIIERATTATTSLFESKSVQLRVEIADDLPIVTGDRDRLIQVVINLISNAIKFTEQGSVTCRAQQEGRNIVISVTDTGIGIAPQDHAKVFEQFIQVGDTLTNKPMGTGLGLPICKQIVEHHGGRIWVDSDLGKGSTFAFLIPISDQAAPPRIPEELLKPVNVNQLVSQLRAHMAVATHDETPTQKTILVVDDDASIRELLHQELESAGYAVAEAKDGRDALAYVKRARPDLVILDVMMPELSGFDVAAVLRNDPQTFNIPIVMLSIIHDRERGYRLGVDRYFTKPMDVKLLLSEIGSLLAQGVSKKKVLIVDEDDATIKVLADALTSQGYHVVSARNGEEGIEKAISDQPDMVIARSVISEKHNLVKTLRFEKGLEKVFFLLFQ